MMRAILIDPFTQKIEVVDYSGDWKDISTLLGCELFTTVYIDDEDTLYIDDEGLYVENQRYFKWKGYPQPLAGRGLVLGCTPDGDTTDSSKTLEDIQGMVEWCSSKVTVMPSFSVLGLDEHPELDELTDKEIVDILFGEERILH
tara:strand:+ start:692 stop:1123 length:432 start_codon:yes stop_codon:yes gene_type:complete